MSAAPGGPSVAVVGAGAMGGVWAGHLARAGVRAILVDADPSVVGSIAAGGLRLGTPGGAWQTLAVPATDRPETVGPVDTVFFFVKAHQTAAAAAGVRALVGPATTVVTQQNGWGSADVLAGAFSPERVVVGVTYHSARVEAPGQIVHTASGPSYVGPYLDGGDLGPATGVAALLSAAGLPAEATAAVKAEIWKKLILNTATLPTSALTRLHTGPLGQPGALLDLLDGLAAESVRVAQALGYDVSLEERLDRIHSLLQGGGAGKSSMLQDVEAKRKTEIEVINGAVVRAAGETGVAVPLNQALVALIGGLERAYLEGASS
ncbi:MAG TPA: 2-dehydropantoate 2-reductase [Chloroflexota bacterium]|nr:2-dehydropantoate 2-reductase [Chloroflexota bacterium]